MHLVHKPIANRCFRHELMAWLVCTKSARLYALSDCSQTPCASMCSPSEFVLHHAEFRSCSPQPLEPLASQCTLQHAVEFFLLLGIGVQSKRVMDSCVTSDWCSCHFAAFIGRLHSAHCHGSPQCRGIEYVLRSLSLANCLSLLQHIEAASQKVCSKFSQLAP